MAVSLNVLDNLKVASPCPMTWDRLSPIDDGAGHDRVRYCGRCELSVYNVANMSAEEATALIAAHQESGERLCAALYRRPDGTLITRDCPVGRAAIRARLAGVVSRVAAAVLLAGSVGMAFAARAGGAWQPRTRTLKPFAEGSDWLAQQAAQFGATPATPCIVMGEIALPQTPPNVPQDSHIHYRDEFGA